MATLQIRKSTPDPERPRRRHSVTPVRCLFVIPTGESFIRKGSQLIAQSFKLRRLANAGEQFLTNRPDEACATIANKIPQ
jgi:hypothetical protein